MIPRILPWLLTALLLPLVAAAKIPDDKIKIGVLQDMPAPYSGETENGGVVAAQLAASDFETEFLKGDGEILAGVHETPDDDLDEVRDWLDNEHVAAVVSSASPEVNHKIAELVAQRHRTLLITAGTNITDELCHPNVVVWAPGSAAKARALALTLVRRGDKRWFLLADRSPAGTDGRVALRNAIEAAGGQDVGERDHTVGKMKLSAATDDINKSGAQVVALSEDDGDLVRTLRDVRLRRFSGHPTFAALYARLVDIDNAGSAAAQGVILAAPFYWGTDDHSRNFARRWSDRMQQRQVTGDAAAVYEATLTFLRAAKAADDIDVDKVIPQLRGHPIKGTLFVTVTIGADGQARYDMGVYSVKRPDEIQSRWAYLGKVQTVPGEKVFLPPRCGK